MISETLPYVDFSTVVFITGVSFVKGRLALIDTDSGLVVDVVVAGETDLTIMTG